MKKSILDRYARTDDDKVIIDITANRIEDLYNNFDKHAPYLKKELDPELVDYILDSVREIGEEGFLIRLRLTTKADDFLMSRIQASIHNYFFYLKELEVRELARMIRVSLIFLAIGISILVLSVWVNQEIEDHVTVLKQVFAEGLTVAAWVSLWEALANFLVNWAPHRRQIKMYERIARAPIIY